MAVNFHLTVFTDIIAPNTSDTAIQHKAAEMHLTPNSEGTIASLKNALITDILGKISAFIQTDEAQTLYSPNGRIDVKKFSARALFLPDLTQTLNEKLKGLYPEAYTQQRGLSTWVWSAASYILS